MSSLCFVLITLKILSVNSFPSFYYPDECTYPHGEKGKCIPITCCPSIFKLWYDEGIDRTLSAFLPRAVCNYEGRLPIVCCTDETSAYGEAEKIIETAEISSEYPLKSTWSFQEFPLSPTHQPIQSGSEESEPSEKAIDDRNERQFQDPSQSHKPAVPHKYPCKSK